MSGFKSQPEISVRSSASNKQEVDQKSLPSTSFSQLGNFGKDGLTIGEKLSAVSFHELTQKLYPIKDLFEPENNIPSEILDDIYLALQNTITSHGFPSKFTNEAERSMLLHCALQVSLNVQKKSFRMISK